MENSLVRSNGTLTAFYLYINDLVRVKQKRLGNFAFG
jgi:hypothetical protein